MYRCTRCKKTATTRSALSCDRCRSPSNNYTNGSEVLTGSGSSPFVESYTPSSGSSGSDYSGGGGSFDGGGSSGSWD